MCPRTKYNRRLVCNSCERHKLASRYGKSAKITCSEKYGNDNPTAVRSDPSRREDILVPPMSLDPNPPMTIAPQTTIPITVTPTESTPVVQPALPQVQDHTGHYTLPHFVGGGSPQNGMLHDVGMVRMRRIKWMVDGGW